MFAEGVRDRIFNTEMVAALGSALSDEKNYYLRLNVVQIFTAAAAQGTLRIFYGDIYTDIFSEGFRDKIFDIETVTALGHALGHKDVDIRSSAVKILTAAVTQGVLCYFYRIFILNCSQRGFGT